MHREQFWDGLVGEQGTWFPTHQNYYGLLDKDYEPAPDYYTHLLWKALVGGTVLRTSTTAGTHGGTEQLTHAPSTSAHQSRSTNRSLPTPGYPAPPTNRSTGYLRAYAYCSREAAGAQAVGVGGSRNATVVLTLVNLRPAAVRVVLEGVAVAPRLEYIMEAEALMSARVTLNGIPLYVAAAPPFPSKWFVRVVRPGDLYTDL